jgi:hypothetical protein
MKSELKLGTIFLLARFYARLYYSLFDSSEPEDKDPDEEEPPEEEEDDSLLLPLLLSLEDYSSSDSPFFGACPSVLYLFFNFSLDSSLDSLSS